MIPFPLSSICGTLVSFFQIPILSNFFLSPLHPYLVLFPPDEELRGPGPEVDPTGEDEGGQGIHVDHRPVQNLGVAI